MTNLSEYINLEHREDGSYLILPYGEFLIGQGTQIRSKDSKYWEGRGWNVATRHQIEFDLYRIPKPKLQRPKKRSITELGLRKAKPNGFNTAVRKPK